MNPQMVEFPKAEVLSRLAVSDSGFVFDPVTGNSFSLNGSGLAILRHLQSGTSLEQMVGLLEAQFETEAKIIERDVIEFAATLRGAFN